MEGGERKEEGSLPANYVSLAQLQERWLRKQQDKKLKEEEERKLKQKVEENRERAGGAHNERGPARYVRATAVVVQDKDKGKGKEIVDGGGGPANGREINKKRSRNKKKKTKQQERATAVEAILSEEIGNVSAVEVSPINGEIEIEIAHVNKTGFRKKGIYKGSRRVNELKQSEMALDLEKYKEKEEGENGHGMKRGERGRDRGEEGGRTGETGGERERGRTGGRVNELKQSETAIDSKKEKEGENNRVMEWRETGREIGRGRNGGRGNELKQRDSKKENEEGENNRVMKWRETGREIGRGRNGGRVNELKQREVALELEEEGKNDRGMKWRERGGGRGRNGGYLIRKEYRPVVVSTVNEVNSKLEDKAEDGISEVCSQITSLNVGDENGIKEDGGVEGQSLNGNKLALESVDHEVIARKSENFWGGYWTDGNPRGGFGRGYRTYGSLRGGFGRGHRTYWIPGGGYERDWRYTRPQISDRMNSTDSVKVWVKKEDTMDA